MILPISYESAEEFTFGSLGGPGASPSDQHLAWLRKTASGMADEYEEVFSRLSSTQGRVQESGHQIEAAWRDFLSAWLPPQYEVKTRKYIVGEFGSGEDLEETDLIILSPNYPRALREKTHILAGGVAAAFSVKSTLKKASVYEAAESCARLQRTLAPREGTPRKELTKPFPYGVLAHSHGWKTGGSDPLHNVSKSLFEADQRHASSPRDCLDLVCVPDLGTWNNIKSVTLGMPMPLSFMQDLPEEQRQEFIDLTTRMRVRSMFAPNPARHHGDVLASFLTSLYSRLAIHDDELNSLADSFSLMGAESGGRGKCRYWDPELTLSPSVRDIPYDMWENFSSNSEFSTTFGWHVPW